MRVFPTNYYAQSMEVPRTKTAHSGKTAKPSARGSYDTGKNGTYKTCHRDFYTSVKVCRVKGGIHAITYTPREYYKKNHK